MKMIEQARHKFGRFLYKHKEIHYALSFLMLIMALPPNGLFTSKFVVPVVVVMAMISIPSAIFIIYGYRRRWQVRILFLAFISLLISTLVMKKGFLEALVLGFYGLSIILSAFYLFDINRNLYFSAISDAGFVLIMVNSIMATLYPDGIYTIISAGGQGSLGIPVYPLGVGNSLPPLILINLGIVIAVYLINKKDLFKVILTALMALVSMYFADSATGYVGLASFIVLLLLYYVFIEEVAKVKFDNRFIKRATLVVFGIILLVHAAFTIINIQKYFSPIIEVLLKKNETFTGRTGIWDDAYKLIKKSPIFGYGIYALNRGVFMKTSGIKLGAHNVFLELGMIGGLSLLTFFIVMVYYTIKSLFRIRNKDVLAVAFTMFICYFIMSITEFYAPNNAIYLFILIELFRQYYSGQTRARNGKGAIRR